MTVFGYSELRISVINSHDFESRNADPYFLFSSAYVSVANFPTLIIYFIVSHCSIFTSIFTHPNFYRGTWTKFSKFQSTKEQKVIRMHNMQSDKNACSLLPTVAETLVCTSHYRRTSFNSAKKKLVKNVSHSFWNNLCRCRDKNHGSTHQKHSIDPPRTIGLI